MKAELADGRILEFPDGTDPAVIQTTIKKMLSSESGHQPVPGQEQPQPAPNPRKLLLFNELQKRGYAQPQGVSTMDISTGTPYKDSPVDTSQMSPREAAFTELAKDTSWLEALGISIGKGFGSAAKGLNLGPEFGDFGQGDATTTEAMKALETEYPKTTTVGEAVGEAAPFIPAAVATGGIASLPLRSVATGLVGAGEGAVLADDKLTGAMAGGGIGFGAELLFPVLGKLGRKVFQRVTGRSTAAPMLTAAGTPTPELQSALDTAGISFDDLTQDAVDFLKNSAGKDPEQVARATMFAQEGIPATKGDITQEFKQQATEQRLMSSVTGDAADPFRQFKLKQSEAIEGVLEELGGEGFGKEATGQRIKDALSGRKKLLRTQKNALYDEAAEAADNIGSVPIFGDELTAAIPDSDLLEDLAITAPGSMTSLDQLLTKYGLKEPSEKMVEAGFEPTPLTIRNFERFRKSINAIERGDQTGAVSVATGPIKEALDSELDNLAMVLKDAGYPDDVVKPLKAARQTVRRLKTEFAPQDIAEKLIASKKNGGVAQVTEASAVYDKLMGAGSKVEDARRVVKLLSKSGDKGKEALEALQSTIILDLLDAGFTTKSRKIAGKNVFNPIAFQNRLAKIAKDGKLDAIFGSNKVALNKLKNLDKIATDITPPSDAVPKGSAAVIMDLVNNIAVSKVPGGNILLGMLKGVSEPIKTGRAVTKAMNAVPDKMKISPQETIILIEKQFPALASALGITAMSDTEEVN